MINWKRLGLICPFNGIELHRVFIGFMNIVGKKHRYHLFPEMGFTREFVKNYQILVYRQTRCYFSFRSSDLFEVVTTAVKHLVIMESTFIYLEKNYNFFNCDRLDVIASKIHDVRENFKSMKIVVKHLHNRSIKV